MTTLAAGVYEDLGDYGKIIPSWLVHPGVLAYLDGDGAPAPRKGFILLGFYEPRGEGATVADLLAIAVEPTMQRLGVGRGLLRYAIELATLIGSNNGVGEIRLTVADSNVAGRRLFRSAGFSILNDDHGLYDGGQRAIRMTRRLEIEAARQRRSS